MSKPPASRDRPRPQQHPSREDRAAGGRRQAAMQPRGFSRAEGTSHPGLCYESLAPYHAMDGKVADDVKTQWLDSIATIAIPDGYREWLKKSWEKSLGRACWSVECVADSPLLVGAGNASGSDVGLTFHHTWGVPMIPGSSLKGLLSHYLDTVYAGDEDEEVGPDVAAVRRAMERPRRDADGRVRSAAGGIQRVIFGAAGLEGSDDSAETATIGRVFFHDMLPLPPDSHGDGGDDQLRRFLTRDVLTVHQKKYYEGKSSANDYDSPTPIPFLCVPAGTRFRLFVGGDREWAEWSLRQLLDALAEWGVGAKTAAGYGRCDQASELQSPKEESAAAKGVKFEIEQWIADRLPADNTFDVWMAFLEAAVAELADQLRDLAPEERKRVVQPIESARKARKFSKSQSKKLRDVLRRLSS